MGNDHLPKVRTFARDLDAVRAGKTTAPVAAAHTEVATSQNKKSGPAVEPSIPDTTPRIPSWKKSAPPLTKPKPAPVQKKSTEEVLEETLQPITPFGGADAGAVVIQNTNEDAATTTIIRDTKRNRFQLFPAIIGSIKRWFAEQKQARIRSRAPKYTVPDSSLRKGVIQKATSKTGKSATFDYKSIQERIKERSQSAQPHKPTTTWSAHIEPGIFLLPSPDEPTPPPTPKTTNVQVVPRKSILVKRDVVVAPSKPIPQAPQRPEPSVKNITPFKTSVTSPLQKTPSKPISIQIKPAQSRTVTAPPPRPKPQAIPVDPTPLTKIEPLPAAVEPTPRPEPIIPEKETSPSPTLRVESEFSTEREPAVTKLTPQGFRDWLFLLNTNVLALAVSGAVVACVCVGALGYFWYQYEIRLIELTTEPQHPTFVDGPLQVLAVSSSKPILPTLIQNLEQHEFPVLQITLANETLTTLLSPQLAFRSIGASPDSSLVSNTSYLYFGSLQTKEHFLLLQVTDATAAQGSLLSWEATILEELLPVIQPGTPSGIIDYRFTDAIVASTDTRVVRDGAGTELMIYGIVDRSLVIIAPDRTTFEKIVTLLTPKK